MLLGVENSIMLARLMMLVPPWMLMEAKLFLCYVRLVSKV